jgi:high-affinity Fe2+/Pb2+ permease
VALAIVVGAVFIVLFYVAKKTIFRGPGQAIFEGFLMLIASFMLTFLAFAMLKVKGYEEKWRLKLEAATAAVRSLLCMALPALHNPPPL